MSVCLYDQYPPCAHCGLPIQGYGSVNGVKLCHPDYGLDCYHLVTLYRHDMPCERPACVASVRVRRERESGEVGT